MRFLFTQRPAKSLFRSNPAFLKIHRHQFSETPQTPSLRSHLLKCPILGIDPAKKLPIRNLLEVFLDSSNGLVCLGRPSLTKQLVLWNPASNLWKYLPRSAADFAAAETASVGFGCSGGDNFSVVRMFSKDTSSQVGVEVYCSQVDGWRMMDPIPGLNFKPLHPKNAAIVNGNPYWLVELHEKPMTAGGVDSRGALLRFNAKEMAFDEMVPLPRLQYHYQDHRATFIDWKGSLGMLVCDKKDGDWLEGIDVWAYEDAEKRWRVDARIGPINLDVDHLMDCSKSGKIVGGCTNGKLFVYDSEKGGGAVVSELERAAGCSVLVFPYDESSAFVEGMVPLANEDKGNDGRLLEEINGFFVTSMSHNIGQIACYYHTLNLMMGSSRDCSTLHVEVDGNIM